MCKGPGVRAQLLCGAEEGQRKWWARELLGEAGEVGRAWGTEVMTLALSEWQQEARQCFEQEDGTKLCCTSPSGGAAMAAKWFCGGLVFPSLLAFLPPCSTSSHTSCSLNWSSEVLFAHQLMQFSQRGICSISFLPFRQ